MKKKTTADLTWFDKGEISQALHACCALMKAGMLSGVYPPEIERASLTFLLINLNDLLQRMETLNHRLEFSDDIHPASNASDITDLINNTRNAACHLNSGNHLLNTSKLSYCVARGYCPTAILIGDIRLGCDYADDAAIIFGANRVYLKRHIKRALDSAQAFFIAVGFVGD